MRRAVAQQVAIVGIGIVVEQILEGDQPAQGVQAPPYPLCTTGLALTHSKDGQSDASITLARDLAASSQAAINLFSPLKAN